VRAWSDVISLAIVGHEDNNSTFFDNLPSCGENAGKIRQNAGNLR